jgi:hypothetical protein
MHHNQYTVREPRTERLPPVQVTPGERAQIERYARKHHKQLGAVIREALVAIGALSPESLDKTQEAEKL